MCPVTAEGSFKKCLFFGSLVTLLLLTDEASRTLVLPEGRAQRVFITSKLRLFDHGLPRNSIARNAASQVSTVLFVGVELPSALEPARDSRGLITSLRNVVIAFH